MVTRRTVGILLGIACLISPTMLSAQTATTTRTAHRAMNATLPAMELKDQKLGKLLDGIRSVVGCNMVVDWKSLEAAGVTRETTLTASLSDLPLSAALDVILSQSHPTAPVLAYVDANIIYVTSQAEADTHLILKTYPVQDLTMANVHLLLQPGNSVQNINNNSGQNGQTGGGLQRNVVSGTGATNNQNNTNGNNNNNQNQNTNQNGQGQQTQSQVILQAQQQAGADLVNLVKTSIRPDIWKDDKGGGGPATVVFFNGMLVVNAPIYVHEAIGGPVKGH